MNETRRDFIKTAALGIGAIYAGSLFSCKETASFKPLNNIGIQLYTLRDQLKTDVSDVLSKVKGIGYQHVETFGLSLGENGAKDFWGTPVGDLDKMLKDIGLTTHSGHYGIAEYLTVGNGDDRILKASLETAKLLGQKYVIVPVPPMDNIDGLKSADYKFMAEQLNKAAELAATYGVRIGYHNHFWEFRPLDGGVSGYDILLNETDKDKVFFEMDLFWSEVSGIDSRTYFEKYPGRFPLWHIKDVAKGNEKPVISESMNAKSIREILDKIQYTELGTGTTDFKKILEKDEAAGLEYAFVEQDQIKIDPYVSIKESYDFLIKEGLVVK